MLGRKPNLLCRPVLHVCGYSHENCQAQVKRFTTRFKK